MVCPYRKGDGLLDVLGQAAQPLGADGHGVQAPQRRKPEIEGEGSEVVAAAVGVLFDESGSRETHEIAVRLGCRHAGGGGQVAQHDGVRRLGQCQQQPAADFDGLDSLLLGAFRFGQGVFLGRQSYLRAARPIRRVAGEMNGIALVNSLLCN